MKQLAIALTLTLAAAAFAEDAKTSTPEELAAQREAKRAEFMKKTGGRIDKPGSQQGFIAFVNTQKKLDEKDIAKVADWLASETRYNVKCIPGKAGDPASVKAAAKADRAVIVVDDATTPAMLVAPEDGWAVVNVAKLDRNLKTDAAKAKFFAKRCRQEILRAYSMLCGGGGSQFEGCPMNCAKFENADLCEEYIPYDLLAAQTRYLKELGITPLVSASYAKACYDGWAPAPTNDTQKAIWEKAKARKAAKEAAKGEVLKK